MPGSSARPARTTRGRLLRGLFLASIVAFAGWIAFQLLPQRLPQRPAANAGISNDDLNHYGGGAVPVEHPDPIVAESIEKSAAVTNVLQQSVCEIVGSGPDGNRTLGAGVVVDRDSVLTCLHVVADTTEPSIRLSSGATLEVIGYRNVDPQNDLALLVVRDPPEWQAISWKEIAADDRPAVAAAGHPQGATFSLVPGTVEEQLATAELPAEEQAFVKRLINPAKTSPENHSAAKIWLQHSALLQQGFSGGPLLDGAGNAIGLNVWVNETAQRSFAINASEVQTFLKKPPQDPLLPPADFASLDARWRATQWAMSGDKLRTVFDQARAMRWQPASQDDYQILQQLALGLNIARDDELLAASGRTAKHVEDLAKSSQPVMVALRKERWRDAGQLILINEFASLALEENSTGLLAFVRVEQVLDMTDKQVDVLVELSGGDEKLIARVDKTLRPPEPGEQWVLLGVQQRERSIWKGQPLPTLVSHVVLPLEGESKK